MLVDDITIRVRAGKGGDGIIAFNATKMNLGPTGGDGGRGGSVFLEGVADIGALNALRGRDAVRAGDGKSGGRQLHTGEDGADAVIHVPVGTVVHGLGSGDAEISSVHERLLAARGGKGGKGNAFFRSSTNTSPDEAEPGRPGEEAELRLELKLIADIGLIGLPNAGKSSLLNRLTRAKSRVGSYPFTTLEPHLGDWHGVILADIPGLIEGASKGKGLGAKFLRHIERTRVLFHLVSSESTDAPTDYRAVRAELGAFNKAILQKPEYLFLTKSDLASPSSLRSQTEELRKVNPHATPISIHEEASLERLEAILRDIRREKGLR